MPPNTRLVRLCRPRLFQSAWIELTGTRYGNGIRSYRGGVFCTSRSPSLLHTTAIRWFTERPPAENEEWITEVEVLEASSSPTTTDASVSNSSLESTLFFDESGSKIETVTELDTFAKAKVINCMKRLQSAHKATVNREEDPWIDTKPMPSSDESTHAAPRYHCQVRLPFPPERYGRALFGEGFADTKSDAETVACMHAERMLDCLGYPIFLLSSKQKRHAEAAAAAGRWAPQPGSKPLDPSEVKSLPPPLQYAAPTGSQQLAQAEKRLDLAHSTFTAVRRGAFSPLKHTLVSAYFYDGASQQRIKSFLEAYQRALSHVCRVTAVHTAAGVSATEPSVYIAQLVLPIDARFGKRVGIGKAPSKREAITLACMHAELIIDALGLALYPQSAESQAIHAKECRQVQRWCAEPGSFDFRVDIPSPPPLMLESDREKGTVSGALLAERAAQPAPPLEDGVKQGTSSIQNAAATAEVVGGSVAARFSVESVLVLHSRAVNDMVGVLHVGVVESSARVHFLRYLETFYAASATDSKEELEVKKNLREQPFFVEALGQRQQETYRATVTVPLRGGVETRATTATAVGIGISDNREDAEAAAAMHALHILAVLNQPWYAQPTTDATHDGSVGASSSTFPPSLEAYAKITSWPVYDPTKPPLTPLEYGEDRLPPPVRCVGPHVNRISSPGLAADWRRRGNRLTRRSGFLAAEVEDRASEQLNSEANIVKELAKARLGLPTLAWSTAADAEGRIIVPPDSTKSNRNYVHTLAGVRQPDLFAEQRLRDYLERYGKNFDSSLLITWEDVVIRTGRASSKTTGEDEGMRGSRHGGEVRARRCTVRVQLPIPLKLQHVGIQGPTMRCIAHGEGYKEEDAVCMCAMHAELLLDSKGIPFYDHPLLQRKHVDTARSLGRWAPLHLGSQPPALSVSSETPPPPPLRKEHVLSTVWAETQQRWKAEGKQLGPDAGKSEKSPESGTPTAGLGEGDSLHLSTAEALRRLQQANASHQREENRTSGSSRSPSPASPGGASSFTPLTASPPPAPQQRSPIMATHSSPQRVAAYPSSVHAPPSSQPLSADAAFDDSGKTDDELCRIESLQPVHHSELFRSAFKHVQYYFNIKGTDFNRTLRQYTVKDEQYGVIHRVLVDIPLPEGYGKRVGIGCAAVKKQAPFLCACHVAWTLDALGIPIYTGRRQHLYATQAREAGRSAPFPGDSRRPFHTRSPKGLCCLSSVVREAPVPPVAPSFDDLQRDRRLWLQYIRATKTYLERKKEHAIVTALFDHQRAPTSGVHVEDHALEAVALLPLQNQTRSQLPALCRGAGLPPPNFFRYEAFGKLPRRMFLTVTPVRGTPYTARGAGHTGSESMHRAAMHYAYLVSCVASQNASSSGGTSSESHGAASPCRCSATTPCGRTSGAPPFSSARIGPMQHLFDISRNDFTEEGKHVLLDLLAFITHPYTPLEWHFRMKSITPAGREGPGDAGGTSSAGAATLVATVTWTDATQLRQGGKGESAVTAQLETAQQEAISLAVKDLYERLGRHAAFQSLTAYSRRGVGEVCLDQLLVVGEAADSAPYHLHKAASNLKFLTSSACQWKMKEGEEEPILSAGTGLRWWRNLRTQPPVAGDDASYFAGSFCGVHSASLELAEKLLGVAEASQTTQDASVDTALLRMGLVEKSVGATAMGTAVSLLLPCLPPPPCGLEGDSGRLDASLGTALGSIDASPLVFRRGRLLPLQLCILLWTSMMWDCLEDALDLVAFVLVGGGEASAPRRSGSGSTSAACDPIDIENGVEVERIEEREAVDVLSLLEAYHSLEAASKEDSTRTGEPQVAWLRQFKEQLVVRLEALHKYLLCALPAETHVAGRLLGLLKTSLVSLHAPPASYPPSTAGAAAQKEAEDFRRFRLRASMTLALLPYVSVGSPTTSQSGCRLLFDGELYGTLPRSVTAEGGSTTSQHRWALAVESPLPLLLFTPPVFPFRRGSSRSWEASPALQAIDALQNMALLQRSLLLHWRLQNDQKNGVKGEKPLDYDGWMSSLKELQEKLAESHASFMRLPVEVQQALYDFTNRLPVKILKFPHVPSLPQQILLGNGGPPGAWE